MFRNLIRKSVLKLQFVFVTTQSKAKHLQEEFLMLFFF